jgi:acetolactate synthase I/II/III large subunit
MTTDTNRLTGAKVMTRVLERYGVRTVFALAGASQTVLLDELDKNRVAIVPSRHESATVGAADGYSRITGKVGIAMINVDQGMPNAITGISSAFEACSPVVVLVGREHDTWTEPEHQIDHDELALVRSITKWARTVHAPERLGEYLDAACRRALAGRPGPVVLAFPKEFLSAAVEPGTTLDVPVAPPPKPAPDPADLARAIDLIAAAQRPIIIAGSGAARAGAGPALRRLTALGIPVMTNAMGRGLVPEDESLGWSWPLAQTAAKQADLVVWLGTRMGKRFGYGLAPRFDASAVMIQVDVHADEIGRNRPVDVGMVADAAAVADAMADALGAQGYQRDPTWLKDALAERLAAIDALGRDADGPIHPYRMGREIMAQMPPGAIFVNDGASILSWMFGVMRIQGEGGYADHFPLGSMGMGAPLALGIAAGAREVAAETSTAPRPVILVTGDGSFGFYPSEYNGAALAGLNQFVTVIANNGVWGNEHHAQPRQIGRTINASFGDVRYDQIAAGYGCHGARITDVSELGPALKEAFARTDKPTVLDVVCPEPDSVMGNPKLATIIYSDIEETRKAHWAGPTK